MRKWIVLLISSFVLIAAFWLFMISERYFFLYPDIDTMYASAFSYDRFAHVKPGQTKDEVLLLLGAPFAPFSNDVTECWWYSQSRGFWSIADFAWIAVMVCFKDDKVVGTYRHVF
jgi:outer membrane protein assembly factor BamE (lipoprotein component of BamABCDE complex)